MPKMPVIEWLEYRKAMKDSMAEKIMADPALLKAEANYWYAMCTRGSTRANTTFYVTVIEWLREQQCPIVKAISRTDAKFKKCWINIVDIAGQI